MRGYKLEVAITRVMNDMDTRVFTYDGVKVRVMKIPMILNTHIFK